MRRWEELLAQGGNRCRVHGRVDRQKSQAMMIAGLKALAAAGLAPPIGIACVDMAWSPYQRQRFVFARSMTSSARPPITAFTMKSVKPFAISSVMDGGIASSVRFTTAS